MKTINNYKEFFEKLELIDEDTSATGGPAGAVTSGGVVSSQPSSLPGVTTEPTYSATGGLEGTGDTSSLLGTSTKQPMGSNHGAMTGKKSRTKKIDLKSLKDIFSKRQDYTSGEGNVDRKPKVMDFTAFQKADITQIKK